MIKKVYYYFTVILLTTASAQAQLKFGAEFTFTNQTILDASSRTTRGSSTVNIAEAVSARDQFTKKVLENCAGTCKKIIERNSYGVEVHKIMYTDGFYFVLSTDPAVVEVQTKPSTVEEYKKYEARLQRDLFDAAKAVGIEPHHNTGGGHIHFDFLEAVGNDVKKLRNLIVDFVNHPETAQGLWAYDYYNSPPLAAQPQESIEEFKRIIADVDSGKIRTAAELATAIRERVYNTHRANWGPHDKYQALNLNRVDDPNFPMSDKTIEMRAIRPQKSIAEFISIISVLEGRVKLNKTRGSSALPVRVPSISQHAGYFPTIDEAMMERHLQYVAEAGVDPAKYVQMYSKSLPRNMNYTSIFSRLPKITRFCSAVFAN